jgi:hypothetical protein
MNALAHKLHEIAIVLENEASFVKEYTACAGESYARARTLIRDAARRFAAQPAHVLSPQADVDGDFAMHNREHLRRYFDDIYDIKDRVGTAGHLTIPLFEFWSDKVKDAPEPKVKPKAVGLPRPGDKFDTSFASRDSRRRARHGMIWTDDELNTLRQFVTKGLSLESICVELQRPADGVINKLRQTHMIATELGPGGYPVYSYTKHILAFQQQAPDELKAEIDGHINRAQEHFSKIEAIAAELQEFSPPIPEKELPIMNAKTAIIEVTTQTLVNGKDVKDFSDAEVYQLIADQEAEIDRLNAIKAKPKKLVAEIEKRQAGIAALVAYLDSKE